MKTLDLTDQIYGGLTLMDLLHNKEFQRNLACGSDGVMIFYRDPLTLETTRYWITRPPRANEQLPSGGTQ